MVESQTSDTQKDTYRINHYLNRLSISCYLLCTQSVDYQMIYLLLFVPKHLLSDHFASEIGSLQHIDQIRVPGGSHQYPAWSFLSFDEHDHFQTRRTLVSALRESYIERTHSSMTLSKMVLSLPHISTELYLNQHHSRIQQPIVL